MILHTYLPMKMEQTECSETSAYKIQTPGNYQEESIQQGLCVWQLGLEHQRMSFSKLQKYKLEIWQLI
jgi:hypothetical protein